MPCYFPLTASRLKGSTGIPLHIYSKLTIPLSLPPNYELIKIPCGQCIGCKLEKSRQWAMRIMHESMIHGCQNSFLTLTYNNDAIQRDENNEMSLNKKDWQLFMKRLRFKTRCPKLKFFMSGEYGETCLYCQLSRLQCTCPSFLPDLGRPHYHAILFGWKPQDIVMYSTSNSGMPVYYSKTLEQLWSNPVTKLPIGISTVGDVTFESAAYVARYVTKKISGDPYKVKNHYRGRLPEFSLMSRRPGIGKLHFEKYYKSIYRHDEVVLRNDLIMRPPKYYDYLYKTINPLDLECLKEKRTLKAQTTAEHTTLKRLADRRQIAEHKLKMLKRKGDL